MIKGFMHTIVGTALGGAAISHVDHSYGRMREATQSIISLGVMSNAAKNIRWKI